MRLHLDEQVHPGIACGLRAHGVDVTSTADADLGGVEDEKHLAFASSEHRVIVTHDRDFLRLHAVDSRHAGIAYCHQEKYRVGELLQMLLLLNACETSEEMVGRLEYL